MSHHSPTSPNVLIYKRTHPGDPSPFGEFGNEDCMGQVRNFGFDFVIGVGGIGPEARSHHLNGKINWVGRWPTRGPHPWSKRGELVTFAPGDFRIFEESGPLLRNVSATLNNRVYKNRNRFLFDALTKRERLEAVQVITKLLALPAEGIVPATPEASRLRLANGFCAPQICKPRKPPGLRGY